MGFLRLLLDSRETVMAVSLGRYGETRLRGRPVASCKPRGVWRRGVSMAQFVNPYTFVPHVATPDRREPAGHERMKGTSLSGVLEITITARRPLMIGGYWNESKTLQLLPRRSTRDKTVMIPGSGFLGAVRSLHEVLVGGCMRVLDTEWVPVHRHPA